MALSPKLRRLDLGVQRRLAEVDLRDREGGGGEEDSEIWGSQLVEGFGVRTRIFTFIWWEIGSQWRSFRLGVMWCQGLV